MGQAIKEAREKENEKRLEQFRSVVAGISMNTKDFSYEDCVSTVSTQIGGKQPTAEQEGEDNWRGLASDRVIDL